jgi:hypothetical protein
LREAILYVFEVHGLGYSDVTRRQIIEKELDFYDIAKIQSYLRALGLRIGIVANPGKNDLEIRGIRA